MQDNTVDKAALAMLKENFSAALRDDLNAPKALALVWETLKENISDGTKKEFIKFADAIFALDIFKTAVLKIPPEAQKLLDAREAARKNKDFKKSDELRGEIAALGFIVKDTPQGQKLEVK